MFINSFVNGTVEVSEVGGTRELVIAGVRTARLLFAGNNVMTSFIGNIW
jgi:hypothetical protein